MDLKIASMASRLGHVLAWEVLVRVPLLSRKESWSRVDNLLLLEFWGHGSLGFKSSAVKIKAVRNTRVLRAWADSYRSLGVAAAVPWFNRTLHCNPAPWIFQAFQTWAVRFSSLSVGAARRQTRTTLAILGRIAQVTRQPKPCKPYVTHAGHRAPCPATSLAQFSSTSPFEWGSMERIYICPKVRDPRPRVENDPFLTTD